MTGVCIHWHDWYTRIEMVLQIYPSKPLKVSTTASVAKPDPASLNARQA